MENITFKEIQRLIDENNPSDEIISVLSFIEERIVKEFPVPVIDFEYFIFSLLKEDWALFTKAIASNTSEADFSNLMRSYNAVVNPRILSVIKPGRVVKYSEEVYDILQKAVEEKKSQSSNYLCSLHILFAILGLNMSGDGDENIDLKTIDKPNQARIILNRMGLSYSNMLEQIHTDVQEENAEEEHSDGPIETTTGADGIKILKFKDAESARKFMDDLKNGKVNGDVVDQMAGQKNKKKDSSIDAFCINLNDMVQQGKITKLVGRTNEFNEIIRVLGRKKKNNVILVGDEGVGKTAIAEGLAYRIVNKDVPMFLQNKEVISLNMTAIVAGTTLRGMFEERVNDLFKEIRSSGKYILLIDDIGNVVGDKHKNDDDFSTMLSKELESGDIQIIATSNFKAYRTSFDKDPSLARRFTKIIVEPPTIKEAIDIISEAKIPYEEFHNVVFPNDVVRECVKLSATYITERNLPDSAIDIIDEAGSQFNTVVDDLDLINKRSEIQNLKVKVEQYKNADNYTKADEVSKELNKLILEYNKSKEHLKKYKEEHPLVITTDNILEIVSSKTGIPVTQMTADDKKTLSSLNDRLKSEIIGQDDQIDLICKAIKRNRVGLRKTGCLYSALFIAKTGVGKTLTAKKLAKEMFGSEDSLIRFDMSEYPDKAAVSKLIGSNPGYVGYEEGGQLTEAVKNKKYCVLLLDEIEKADKEVYNIFLQVLDEGFLTDNSGCKVDFSNVIVLFTSNVGAKKASAFGGGIGFNTDVDKNTKSIMKKELKNQFPPEFLNRLDNIIYFNALTKENLRTIIRIELDKLVKNVSEIGYKYEYTDKTVDFIYGKVSEELEYGARPIRRAIQENIEDKITDEILESEELEQGHVFNLESQY